MNSRRTARVAQAIRESLSETILFGLKDPRIRNVTVTNVEVTGDLRSAKVRVSIMGDDKVQKLSLHGLNSAKGFLQRQVADRLQTRYTPVLKFILDQGVKHSMEATRILNDVLPGASSDPPPDGDDLAPSGGVVVDSEDPRTV